MNYLVIQTQNISLLNCNFSCSNYDDQQQLQLTKIDNYNLEGGFLRGSLQNLWIESCNFAKAVGLTSSMLDI